MIQIMAMEKSRSLSHDHGLRLALEVDEIKNTGASF